MKNQWFNLNIQGHFKVKVINERFNRHVLLSVVSYQVKINLIN